MDAVQAYIRDIGKIITVENEVVTAKEKGDPVTNVPTYGSDAVGQFAIAMLL